MSKELEEAIEINKQLREDYRGMLPHRWEEMKPQMEALRLVIEAAEAFRKIALITEYMDFCLRNKTKPRKEGGAMKEPGKAIEVKDLEKAIKKCKEIRDARICLPGLREGARALDLVIEAAEERLRAYQTIERMTKRLKECKTIEEARACVQKEISPDTALANAE